VQAAACCDRADQGLQPRRRGTFDDACQQRAVAGSAATSSSLRALTRSGLPDADRGIQRILNAELRALVDRLAKELIEMSEFRSAPTAAQRRRLALTQHAEIAA
jgi:hypothetical protein